MLTIGLVSPGAMGAAVGRRLVEHGAQVLAPLDGRGAASRRRARAAGLTEATLERAIGADLFLSIVPPASALEVARRFAAIAGRSDQPSAYVDCNALSPDTKREVGAIVEAAGARMVDGCIIGLPGDEGGPWLYLSGEHARMAEPLGQHGLRVVRIDAPVGAAAALKMCFAGMNKGMLALAGMMILSAERAGVAGALGHALAANAPDRLRMKARLPATFARAWRWAPEMLEIAAFATPEDGAAEVFEGMARFWQRIAADHAGAQADQASLASAMAEWPAP